MPVCQHCGNTNLIVRGYRISGALKMTHYQCKRCNKYTTLPSVPDKNRSAKILCLDIETSLMKFYGFSPKTEYIPHELMIEDWSILCWGAKWLFEPEIMGETVTPDEALRKDDKRILEKMWDLLNEADIIITQNGINFDMKKLRSRFLLNGFFPFSHVQHVDTLKVSRETFGWSYNRLDALGQKFGIGKKSDMEIEDWIQCGLGSQEHITKMFEYCKRDVAPLLEDVYLIMLPWMDKHPNLGLYTDHDGDVCPKCESSDLKWGLEYSTPSARWNGFRCQSCGAIGRGKGKENKLRGVNVTN